MQENRWFKKIGVLMLAMFLALAVAMPAANATENWQQKFIRFSGVAGETLTIGDVVCIAAADGQIYKADADSSTRRPAVGVIDKGGATNATVEIVVMGILDGQAAASPGTRLFLSTGAGGYAYATTGYDQIIGWVLPGTTDTATSTKYFINVHPEPPSAGSSW
jgi:hypothetical protein